MNVVGGFLGSQSENDHLPLIVVHLNIFVYAATFWLTQPVFPYLVTDLGADLITFGYLQTAFSVAQMLGSLVFGRVADSYGARMSLHASQLGGALSYALLASATSVPLLFLSRLPTTLQHCMMAAQAAVSAYTSEETRTKALGLLSLSYGGGMVVGSAVGGQLSAATSYSFVAALASVLSFAIIPLTHALLPPVRQSPVVVRKAGSSGSQEGLGAAVKAVLANAALKRQLLVIIVLGSAFSLQRSSFSMLAKSVFALEASELGYVMSLGGIISMLTNVGLAAIPKEWNDRLLLGGSAALLVPSFVAYTFVRTLPQILMVLVPISVCSTLIYTLNTSMQSKTAGPNAGLIIGLNHSIRSALGIVSPTLAGYMLASSNASIGFSAAALCAAGAFIVFTSSA